MLLRGLTWLVLFQLIGTALNHLLLPVLPGPIIGLLLMLGFLVWRLGRRQHVMAFDRELLGALRLDRAILAKVMRIGLPTGLQMVVISMSELVILALVNGHGSQATAFTFSPTMPCSWSWPCSGMRSTC